MASETPIARSHPRRTPASPDALVDAFQSMSLRKLDTVHAPTNTDSELLDPIDAARGGPSNPLRSTTCPQSLEALLIGAGERRAADLLARVDQAIATQSKLALGNVLRDPEVLPVPPFMADGTIEQDSLKTRARSYRRSHSSDSGIGSSVESVSGKSSRTGEAASRGRCTGSNKQSVDNNTIVADDQPSSSIDVTTEERGLSEYAKDQIHKHIVKPILREQSLKEFHPILKDVPRRIGNKEIKTLRELEKALIFVAPEFSSSPSKYLNFCERTIRVLHTTVTTLHDSDKTSPTERPYTQSYFVDLVEQIRRYATILAATRQKKENGEKLGEMDYSPDEKVELQGGLSHNGKPAELVRHKDGKVISIATGKELSPEELATSIKRPMSDEDVDNDDVLRSMARRKKNAKPEIHECPICDKEFKRPCDLTKHVKTHERPWKCPDSECKYHALGWPTEKERDRHVNDKHSAAPSLYHCRFPPCPYTSKRESNCKQHMEKAHGWVYVRSKNNGKGRASDDVSRLPFGSVPPSPASAMLTPLTPIAPSPSVQSWSTSSRADSMAPPMAGPSNYGTPFPQPSPDFGDHFNMNFDFNDISDNFASTALPMTPAMSEDRGTSISGASSHGLILDGNTFNDAITPDDINFNANFNFETMQYQQPTPNSNIGMSGNGMDVYQDFSASSAGPSSAYLSPNNAEMAFISPHPSYDGMEVGEEAMSATHDHPNQDFTLFNNAARNTSTGADMFPTLSEGGSWANYGTQFDLNNPMQLKSDNSALNELFPELTNHM